MSRNLRKSVSLFLAVLTLITCFSCSLIASAVGKVASLKASSVTETSISLTWSKVKDADGYRLYKYNSSTKKWQTLKTTTATSYTDKGLAKGTENSYAVKAIDVVNGKYVYSNDYDVVKVLTLPGTAGTLKATAVTMDSVTLSWSKADGAQGYAVYQYNNTTKKYDYVGSSSSTTYTVKNLKASSSYKFGVRAYVKKDYVAYGKATNVITVNTPALNIGKVKNLRLDALNATAYRIKWDTVANAEGYQVALYDTAAKKWKNLGTTTKNSVVFTAADVNGNYEYKVRAFKKTDSGYVIGDYSDAVTAFAKPGEVKVIEGAENSNRGISLRWNKVSGVNGYEIYSYDAATGNWVFCGETTKNSYNVTGINQTSIYKYKVRAFKISGGKKFYGDFCESVTINYHGTQTDSVYSEEMAASGVFGYLYDPNEKCFYTAGDPWQRNVGYNSVFDTTAPLALITFETARLRFEYGDKDWMIQVWKGQYGLVFYGAEIGVYTKPKDRVLMHYDCASDADMLKMSMVFNENKSGQWQERFTRPYGYYWWCTGFLPGNRVGKFDTLSLDIRITAKDYDMLSGIKSALEQNSIDYKTSGLDVYFTF